MITPIAIVFTPGCYGNFIHWCIEYFSGGDIEFPFDQKTGRSHIKSKNFKFSYDKSYYLTVKSFYTDLTEINPNCEIVLVHPTIHTEIKLIEVVSKFLDINRKVIFLNCTENSVLLNINNKITKNPQTSNWMDSLNILKKNIERYNKNRDSLNTWEERELLSFFVFKQHESESEYKTFEMPINDNFLYISIESLIDNFESTIRKIFNFINLDIHRENFDEIYSEWIKLQFYKDSDKNAKEILSAILNNKFLDWSDKNLSIVDEAWIQYQLRDEHGIEIKCWNLNKFPTNTEDLKSYLIYQNT